ncbi:MAG TPA: DUF692 domain-containing protein [Planctomycetota bacterium]|nr:DUF692 domain-containing protein [Planctomycetota bacterium]
MRPYAAKSRATAPLGFGVGLRKPHVADLAASTPRVDWFEFTPENYMNRGGAALRALRTVAERYPTAAHGVGASLGSPRGPDRAFLRQLAETCRLGRARWASDHACYTTADGRSLNELFPLPFTEEAVRVVARNVRRVRDAIEAPYLIENISYYATPDAREMDEAAFLTAVLEEADCGLLLDVNNVYVNATNHGYDARAFLRRLPLHRVVQVHLAGHDASGPILVDTHGAPVPDPVWDLFADVAPLLPPCSVLVEWDNDVPSLARLLEEADRARAVWAGARDAHAAAPASTVAPRPAATTPKRRAKAVV